MVARQKNKHRLYVAYYCDPSGTTFSHTALMLCPKDPKENARRAFRFDLVRQPVLGHLELKRESDFVRPDNLLAVLLLGKLVDDRNEDWLYDVLRRARPSDEEGGKTWVIPFIDHLVLHQIIPKPSRSATALYMSGRQMAENMARYSTQERAHVSIPTVEMEEGMDPYFSEIVAYEHKVEG